MYKKELDKSEKHYLEKLELIPKWPMYVVVVPGAVGIYDDIIKAANDAKGSEAFHFCTKYRVMECINNMGGYYNYHFPNDDYNHTSISEKNELFKVA